MKPKKLLFTLITSTVVLSGGVLVACGSKDDGNKDKTGPENGVYYNYSMGGGTVGSLTLSKGNKAALELDGTNLSGSYTVKNGALKLKLKGQKDIEATLDSDVITFTYNSEELKFWKDIDYTVTYETYGGSAVSQSNVKYGAYADVPGSPTRGEDAFIGWTTVANGNTLYSFDVPVTGDLTLHAKWVQATDHEFALKLDLGYAGAAQLPGTKTVANRAYNLPTPTRSGYTFKGWWVSQYDSVEKLSYLCKIGETEFGTDTTLYAKWQKDGEVNPDITVTNSGISWEGTGSGVTVVVKGPSGYGNNGVTQNSYGATGTRTEAIDFTKAPAGDYEITLESGGKTYKLYYKNKAVSAVYGLKVVNNNTLQFAAVDGAEKYYIDIDCGTPGHNHAQIDNGTKTTYDFSACDMKTEGITFTVYASAAGKAMSVGRSINHEAHLAPVDTKTYKLDKETGVLTWTAVEHAQNYAVSINGGAAQTVKGNSISLNNYDGEVKVKVIPQGHGYNPGEATEYKYTRTSLSTPKNLYIEGTTLKWTGDTNAKEYEIKVGTVTLKTTATELDLSDKVEWQQDQEYDINIRSLGDTAAKTSYWSNTTEVTYSSTTSPTPKYSASTVSWAYTLGVDYYEVQVNDGQVVRVNENSLSNIVLTKKGANTIKLRSVADGNPNEWKTVQVNAYQIAFETGEGVAISNYYKAVGDNTNLPTPERVGYDFSHWSTAAENGSVYNQETFTGESDITLYAAYTPRKYTVNLDYGSYGAAPDQNSATAKVEFDSDDYKLPVPTITNGKMLFVGWNTSALGNGVVYTDYSGAAATAWKNANDGYTLYAVYVEAFSFEEDGDGYTVSAGSEIAKASHLIIPDTYNNKKVRSLNENAFKNRKTIESVSIPSTVRAIPETAFEGCSNLKRYESYVSALEPDAMYYATADGMLLRDNFTGTVDLMFIPNYDKDKFSVPSGVTHLRSEVFKGLAVTEIVIPASVRTIADSAFKGCNSLTKVTFEDGPDSLTMNIGAFNGCANIIELVLPGRLASMGTDSEVVAWLQGFRYLKKITVEGGDNSTAYASDENGMLFNGAKDTLIYCPRASELTEYVVPSTVLHIADGAFAAVSVSGSWESRKLTSITFHNQMRSIGAKAFYRNSKLKTVTFASSATRGESLTIGEEAFYYCTGITTLDFQETGALNAQNVYAATATCGVAEIGNNAFNNVRVTSVTLPSTLTSIGDNAFSGNNLLYDLDLGHIKKDLTFGDSVFSGNTSLIKVEITANIGVIEFQNVFKGCNIRQYDVSKNPNYSVDNVTNEQGEVTGCVIYDQNYTKIIYINNVDMSTYQLKSTLKEISGGIFSGRTDITKFTVPAAVTSIGAYAFQNCANLEEIIFEAGTANLTIGAYAFNGCSKLTEITIPGRTTSMGASLFTGTGITTVTFAEGVTAVPARIFQNVTSLKTVNLPSTLKTVGEYAFYGSGVETVTFTPPASGKTPVSLEIKDHAFAGCASLESIVLPEGLQCVSESMFENCSALESVTIPTTVKNTSDSAGIGKSAFYNCGELTDIIFTEGGTDGVSFGECSLYNTMKLTIIDLPTRAATYGGSNNVFALSTKTNSLGALIAQNQIGAFDSNSNGVYQPKSALQTIKMGGQTNGSGTYFSTYDGVLYSANHAVLLLCPKDYAQETLEVSKYATSFGAGAFRDVTAVKHIVFQAADALYDDDDETALPAFSIASADNGNYSAEVTEQVLYGCKSVESIAFPARLTEIGAYAFWKTASPDNNNYSYLKQVTFITGATDKPVTIGEGAFLYSGITSLVMPNNLTTIGARAFYGSKNLSSVTWSSNLERIESDPRTSGTKNGAFEGTALEGELELPATLKYIGDCTFRNLSGVTSIALPANLETLGNNAFNGTGITKITLPASMTIDSNTTMFYGCNSLTEITFDGDVLDYHNVLNALNGTTAGVKLKFVNTTEKHTLVVESGILYGKDKKEDGSFVGTLSIIQPIEELSADLVIPAGVVSIASSAFYGITGVNTITFAAPESSETSYKLNIAANAFVGTSATIIDLSGRSLVNNTFGESAFADNSLLETVKLPASLAVLPVKAFQNDIKLKTVTFGGESSSLGTIGNYAFDGCSAFTGTSETEFKLPASVTTLGTYAFQNCTSLVNFVLPASDNASLKTISDHLFDGCTSLSFIGKTSTGEGGTVTKTDALPANVTTIGSYAFNDCKLLKNVAIPAKTTTINTYAFQNCGVYLAEGQTLQVTFVGTSTLAYLREHAFEGSALGSITLPKSVQWLGTSKKQSTAGFDSYLFAGCTRLTSVDLSKLTVSGTNYTGNKFLGRYLFKGCTALTTVTFTTGYTTIGDYAFENCTAFETLTINNTAAFTINANAFKGSGLTTINFAGSANVTVSGSAFANCDDLVTLNIQPTNGTVTISAEAFTESGLETVNVSSSGGSTTTFSTDAFKNCGSLATVNIASSSTKAVTFNKDSFNNCNNLNTINVLSSGTGGVTFKTGCLSNVSSLQNIRIATTSKYAFEGGAFDGCTGLTSMALGTFDANLTFTPITNLLSNNCIYTVTLKADETVDTKSLVCYVGNATTLTLDYDTTAILASALKGNTIVTTLNIPASVTTVGNYAFQETAVQTVTFGCVESGEIPKTAATTLGDSAFKDTKSLTTVNFNGVVTTIGTNAFNGASSLENIDLTKVTSIGSSAFANTGRLHAENGELEVPASVTKIDSFAFNKSQVVNIIINADCCATIASNSDINWFSGCEHLGTVTLGSNITRLGNKAFVGCSGFTLVFDMNNIAINAKAFEGSSGITFETGDNCTNLEFLSNNNMIATKDTKTLLTVLTIPENGQVVVPEGIIKLDNDLFNENTAIKKITLPTTITTIGDSTFYKCSALTEVVNMNYVKSFGSNAFYMSGITSVTINENANLGSRAFNDCKSISGTVTLGSGVTFAVNTTSYGVFEGCTGITEVKVYTSFVDCAENAKYLFKSCTALTTVTVYGTVVVESMFQSCTKINSISLPDVTTIKANAFNGCTGMTGVIELKNVTSIDNAAFTNCNGDIYIDGNKVTSLVTPVANQGGKYQKIHVVGKAKPESAPSGWTLGSAGLDNIDWNVTKFPSDPSPTTPEEPGENTGENTEGTTGD